MVRFSWSLPLRFGSCLAAACMVGGADAQSPAEATALASLGEGMVVYSHEEKIYRYILDGTGTVTPELLADKGVSPTVSHDGQYVAYVVYNGNMGDLWVMAPDGGGRRKITSSPVQHLSTPNFANDHRIVYAAGPASVRPYKQNYGYFPQEVWVTDLDGNASKVLSKGGNGSYYYFNELDLHGEWVAYRWYAQAYVGRYTGGANALANVYQFGQRCGMSFNPAGDQITINNIPHTQVTIHRSEGMSWLAGNSVDFTGGKHEHIRWTNKQEWITCNKEENDADIYAYNTVSGKSVRLTFEDGRTWFGNLFFGSTKPCTQPPSIVAGPTALTVAENGTAVLTVTLEACGLLNYQWLRAGVPVEGATKTTYTIPAAALSDNGVTFFFTASNQNGAVQSRGAVLTVTPDREAPRIVEVRASASSDGGLVRITFDEPVDRGTAESPAAYAISDGVTVTSSHRDTADRSIVNLETTAMLRGNTYTLTVSGVKDMAAAANPVAPGTSATFAVARVKVLVNFQPANVAVPSGFAADIGTVYGDRGNGYTYGWDRDNTAHTRERLHTGSPEDATLNHMQYDRVNYTWEMAVPNGSYDITLVAGDAGYFNSSYRIDVEGTRMIDGTPSSSTRFFTGRKSVSVSDGKLTVSNAPTGSGNKVCWIHITSSGSTATDTGGNGPASIEIVRPIGGESFAVGQTLEVEVKTNVSVFAVFALSWDAGRSWHVLNGQGALPVDGNGVYRYTIPDTIRYVDADSRPAGIPAAGNAFLLRVYDYDNAALNDMVDRPFTIVEGPMDAPVNNQSRFVGPGPVVVVGGGVLRFDPRTGARQKAHAVVTGLSGRSIWAGSVSRTHAIPLGAGLYHYRLTVGLWERKGLVVVR